MQQRRNSCLSCMPTCQLCCAACLTNVAVTQCTRSLACSGHGSFSNSKQLNNLVGNIVHSSILVPYHGWRISHRTHHANHGHVENDESWYPTTEKLYENMVRLGASDSCWSRERLVPYGCSHL